MKIWRFAVTLRLWHPDLDRGQIARELGLEEKPRRAAPGIAAGTRDLGAARGKLTETYWMSKSRSGQDHELLEVLDRYVQELGKSSEFLAMIRETGGRAELLVGWFASTRSGGPVIGHDLLMRLGNLHLDLSLDIYCTNEDPDDLDYFQSPEPEAIDSALIPPDGPLFDPNSA